ncbi:hypothetical protein PPERSA_03494 [Pseudocohnilembus persalinus]|uniref:Uncharacterized protein n=1 Tax=Pseudocohnilembus persalinus TaxID=266149 RepID=A0A0V0QBS5_PSEPJ|nr:hypothetical protein PPERSA_03494 [Pseudocohnilembus persalinus]|eukprot:KRW99693.1 hypothetical protein PPERSA_03494 [Pseudocohnilembus persalinus]
MQQETKIQSKQIDFQIKSQQQNQQQNLKQINQNLTIVKPQNTQYIKSNQKTESDKENNNININNHDILIRHDYSKQKVQPKLSLADIFKPQEINSKKNSKKLKITQLKMFKPTNIEQQKQIFFEKNCQYDPQFVYQSDNINFSQFPIQKPHTKYLQLAQKILDTVVEKYGSDIKFFETQGQILSKEETQQYYNNYIEKLGFKDKIKVVFQEHCVSTTTCSHNQDGTAKIIIGLPISYRKGRITGVMNHEIGTHFIRKFNNSLQKWSKKRKPYGLQPYMKIEEGLAGLNTHLEQVWDPNTKPFLYHMALHYYAQYMASQVSFSDLYKDLEKYIQNPDDRWRECVRVKRGIKVPQKY